MSIGILHPGAMGISIGAALVAAGHEVCWVSENRSDATRQRAESGGLIDVATIGALNKRCTTVFSVCPPGEAETVAATVAAAGFQGRYIDANAVAPATARGIAETMTAGGADYVDGGIIGPPIRHKGLTVLYLAGAPSPCDEVTSLFVDTALETHYVGAGLGSASAVKMAFAAWTKGTSALLLAIRGLAEAEGVVEGVEHAWSVLTPDLIDRLPMTAQNTAPKAWRFVGEMEEIATSFEGAGLPGGFHHAAAEIYAAFADLRDQTDVTVDDVVRRLARD